MHQYVNIDNSLLGGEGASYQTLRADPLLSEAVINHIRK